MANAASSIHPSQCGSGSSGKTRISFHKTITIQKQKMNWQMLSVSVALKGSAVPFTAYLYDSSKASSLSSLVVLLKTQRLKLWYHQKRSRTGIFLFFFCCCFVFTNKWLLHSILHGCPWCFEVTCPPVQRNLIFVCSLNPQALLFSVFIQVRFLSSEL